MNAKRSLSPGLAFAKLVHHTLLKQAWRVISFPSQITKSSPFGLLLLLVAGMGLEPHDLQVMSLTSYRTALPRVIMPI